MSVQVIDVPDGAGGEGRCGRGTRRADSRRPRPRQGDGAPRVSAELNDGAPPERRVNHKRVARVMAEHGIPGIRLRRRVRTTIPEPSDQKVSDVVNRDFAAPAPNRKYVGDITYLPLADGSNLYLATVIDCCSRKLAGWAVADQIRGQGPPAVHEHPSDSTGWARSAHQHRRALRVSRSVGHDDLRRSTTIYDELNDLGRSQNTDLGE